MQLLLNSGPPPFYYQFHIQFFTIQSVRLPNTETGIPFSAVILIYLVSFNFQPKVTHKYPTLTSIMLYRGQMTLQFA